MAKIRALLALVFAVAGLAMQGAHGQVLYAADGQGGVPGNLYVINQATGAIVQTIGPIGFAVTGLAFHPGTGVLYGTTGAENDPPALIRINTTTGAGTLAWWTALPLVPTLPIRERYPRPAPRCTGVTGATGAAIFGAPIARCV